MIVLTHCDIDHIVNALELRTITGARIAAHPEDAEYIAGRKVRLMPKGGMRIMFKLFAIFMKVQPFQVDLMLNDGDKVAGYTVLHVPGHTPGSIALYNPKQKVLFTGDTLGYQDWKLHGQSEKFTMDIERTYRSIEKLKLLNFDFMLGGHGEPLRSGASVKVRDFTNA